MTSRTLFASVIALLAATAAGAAAVPDTHAPLRAERDAGVAPAVAARADAGGQAATHAPAPRARRVPIAVGDIDVDAMLADVEQQVARAMEAIDIQDVIEEELDELDEIDVDGIVAQAMQVVEPFFPGTPRLGVGIRDLTADEAKGAGLDGIRGAWVTDVRPDSPAAKAGLAENDVIMRVDAEDVRSARHLSRLVSETPAGRAVSIEYLRGGQRATATVTPESAMAMAAPGRARPFPGRRVFSFAPGRGIGMPPVAVQGRLGIAVQGLSSQLAGYFGVERGVLVTNVTDGSPAARGGLKAGDVITKFGATDVGSVGDLMRSLRDAEGGDEVEVQITRDRQSQTLTVTPDATPTRERRVIRSRSRSAAI